MSILEHSARAAFDAARQALPRLREPQKDGTVYLNRFAEVGEIRYATGVGVTDVNPKPRAATWTSLCEGVAGYAETVIGPEQDDKKHKSRYLIAGEISRTVRGLSSGDLALESRRADVEVVSQTLLVLDCDSPVASAPLCFALDSLHLAYVISPTWSSTIDSPRWRCFLPIAPIPVDNSPIGRAHAQCRYAWLAGLIAALADLPTICPACEGAGETGICPSCLSSGVFRFDLTCWNYSRLHFLGGRPTADIPMTSRQVRWAKGYALDTAAWLEGSGFSTWWEGVRESLTVRASGVAPTELGIAPADSDIATAAEECQVTLLERVRRAALYVGSPQFPASVSGARGHDALMRAASAVVSGFLVPLLHDGEEWALRVLEVAYNPRCTDLDGNPFPWSSRDLRKKLRDVRVTSGTTPGSMLDRRSDEGALFYVVRSDGKQGHPPSDAGVYNERGEQKSVSNWNGALLELSVDAARACPIRPFDPEALPPGFRARKTVISIAGALAVGSVSAANGAIMGAVSMASGGLSASPTGKSGVLRSLPGAMSGLPSLGKRGGIQIPDDADWTEPVVIGDDDMVARRIIAERMNARFAVVAQSRDCVIVDTMANMGRRGERAYMTVRGFQLNQQRFPLKTRIFSSKGAERLKDLNRADLWLSSPFRREYDEWGFAPELSPAECEAINPETGRRRLLNTFQGFPVAPNERGLLACPRFAELVDEVIADGSEASSRYIWTFFADLFQRPADKSGVALYLYSPEKGTGKGTLFKVIGALLGRYYQLVQSADQVAGQWNLHLADKLLIFFDEARGLEGRDRADKLNSLITETEFAGSEKFAPLQTCRAYARYAFASNREDGVSIQVQDRRYAAFRVSARRRKDARFFEALWKELYAPCEVPPVSAALDRERAARGDFRGLSGLMHHLANVVRPAVRSDSPALPPVEGQPYLGGGVELREIPNTDLRMKMMLSSLEGVEAFVFSAACQTQHLGFVDRSHGGARTEKTPVQWRQDAPFKVMASEFTVLYNAWAKVHGQRSVASMRKPLEAVFTLVEPVVQPDGQRIEQRVRHPDFGVGKCEVGDLVGLTEYRLPAGPSVYAWLARKYGW